MRIDHWVACLIVPLTFWVLLNGLDDLIIDIAALWGYIRQHCSVDPRHRVPTEEELDAAPPRLIAVFVPVWREHKVIQRMIDNNVAKLRYPRFAFFVGGYPNDIPTLTAIREAMKRFPNVHLSICPHSGGTSKADNLNWIYQRMLLYEERHGVRFDLMLTHDAEDMMDPHSLRWINYYAQWNDFVQIPVLAMSGPIWNFVQGLYCDDFAESQFRDMVARQTLGGFIPSSGVGTAFSRRALDMLAERHSNRIFEPTCLTEDYENGFRVMRLGLPQKFIPIHFRHGRAIATQELFPRDFKGAVRQRSRWIQGITLQSWEFHSFRETVRYACWFWRDRRGLVGSFVSPLTNIVWIYGALTRAWAESHHHAWGLAREGAYFGPAFSAALALLIWRTGVRIGCCWRIYGFPYACAVPLRIVFGNALNLRATSHAVWKYSKARILGKALEWNKTEHYYPNRQALLTEWKRLGGVLTGGGWITVPELEAAVAAKPEDRRLGEHLIVLGLITERDLYEALALQSELPLGKPDADAVSVPVTRALPAAVARRWRALPFRIAAGEIYVAGSDLPSDEMQKDIGRFSSLEIRFHLVTPTEFEELASHYLGSRT